MAVIIGSNHRDHNCPVLARPLHDNPAIVQNQERRVNRAIQISYHNGTGSRCRDRLSAHLYGHPGVRK
jgi:hypothetical protein